MITGEMYRVKLGSPVQKCRAYYTCINLCWFDIHLPTSHLKSLIIPSIITVQYTASVSAAQTFSLKKFQFTRYVRRSTIILWSYVWKAVHNTCTNMHNENRTFKCDNHIKSHGLFLLDVSNWKSILRWHCLTMAFFKSRVLQRMIWAAILW